MTETFEAMSWHDPRWAGDRENVEAKFKAMYPTYTIDDSSVDYLIYSGGNSNKFHVFFFATDPAGNYHSFNAYGRIGYTPTLHHNAGPASKSVVTQAIRNKRRLKAKKGYVQQAEGAEDDDYEYRCDICDKPAKYNFQDSTLRWEIIDDDFAGKPMWSEDSGQSLNDFYCGDCVKKHETSSFFNAESFEADFDYYYTSYDKGRGMEILDRLRTMNPETKAEALDWLIDNGYLHSEEVYDSAYINAMGDALYITSEEDEDDYDAEVRMPQPDSGTWTPSPYQSQFGQSSGSVGQIGTDKPSKPIMPKSFSAEYTGPSTLSSALSGARKTGKNGKHLTIIQRLVAKYGIEKGSKIYKHFGVKQKRASPKVRGKVRGTKSGPRRYSEGRVGGAGRSQVYQKGDRTGSWTPSGGHTTRFANSGKAWYQERGLGTPVAGPIPDTELAGKAMGQKRRGMFVNPAGIVGYPFVPAQQRERKSRK